MRGGDQINKGRSRGQVRLEIKTGTGNKGMTVSDQVLEDWRKGTGKARPPPFYLCCHLVPTIPFPPVPFWLTLPSSVTHPISTFLMLFFRNSSRIIIVPLLFPRCFIYSVFNFLWCICSPFFSAHLPSSASSTTSSFVSVTHSILTTLPVLLTLVISMLVYPLRLSEMPLVPGSIYITRVISFLYNSCSFPSVMHTIPLAP